MKTTKTLYKAAAVLAASQCLFSANAQTITQYFMKWNPQQHQLNPAFRPEGKFYIGMPALSSLNFNVGNNNLVFTDVLQNVTIDGKQKTVLFLDKNAKPGSTDDFLDRLSNSTRIFYDHRINLVDFGFKAGKGFFTLNLTNRAMTNVLVPKAISTLALKGIEEGETFKLKGGDLAVDATAFTEIGLGYSREINDKLNIGAKFKFLYGHANVYSDFSDITITGNETLWELKGKGNIQAACPGLKIYENEDSKIDSLDFDDDIEVRELTKPQGKGFAVDLGATYKLMPQLTVSASVLDLGFIHWSKNLHKLNKKGDFVWDGIAFDINDDEDTDYGEKYEDMFDAMFDVDNSPAAYTTWLNTKVMLGGEYSLWKDRLGLGLLAKGQFYRGKLYGNGTASVNFRPWRQLSATVAYGLFDGEWNNLGAGLNLNAGPINLYCAVDNIPFKFAKSDGILIPSNTEKVQLSLGMNLYFGYRKKKDKNNKEEENTEELAPAPVLVEENKDNNEQSVAAADSVIKAIEQIQQQLTETADATKATEQAVTNVDKAAEQVVADAIKAAEQATANVDKATEQATANVDKATEQAATNVDKATEQAVAETSKATEQAVAEVTKVADTVKATEQVVVNEIKNIEKEAEKETAKNEAEPVVPAKTKEVSNSLKELQKSGALNIKFLNYKNNLIAIDPASYPALDKIANEMNADPDLRVTIECHTALLNDKEFSYWMTEERANLIRGYFVDKGVDYNRITTVGMGADKPLVKGKSESANKANTRTVLIFSK